jgi:hypothetical protein
MDAQRSFSCPERLMHGTLCTYAGGLLWFGLLRPLWIGCRLQRSVAGRRSVVDPRARVHSFLRSMSPQPPLGIRLLEAARS